MGKDIIYITECDTPQQVVNSRGFIGRLQEVLKIYAQKTGLPKAELRDVNDAAYRVSQGNTLCFTAYDMLKSHMFHPNFSQIAHDFFTQRVAATGAQFETIDENSLRVSFFQKAVSSLVKYIVESGDSGKIDREEMQNFGNLKVYPLGGEYIVKDIDGEVHHLGYLDPVGRQYGYAIFHAGEKLRIFDTSTGKQIPQSISRHMRMHFGAFDAFGTILITNTQESQIVDKNFQTLYSSKISISYSQKFQVFLEGDNDIPTNALFIENGKVVSFPIAKDSYESDGDRIVFGVMKQGRFVPVFEKQQEKK